MKGNGQELGIILIRGWGLQGTSYPPPYKKFLLPDPPGSIARGSGKHFLKGRWYEAEATPEDPLKMIISQFLTITVCEA